MMQQYEFTGKILTITHNFYTLSHHQVTSSSQTEARTFSSTILYDIMDCSETDPGCLHETEPPINPQLDCSRNENQCDK